MGTKLLYQAGYLGCFAMTFQAHHSEDDILHALQHRVAASVSGTLMELAVYSCRTHVPPTCRSRSSRLPGRSMPVHCG